MTITLLKPQLNRGAIKFLKLGEQPHLKHYNYYAIVDGRATFVKGFVRNKDEIRVAKIAITGESKNGNAQFGKVIEFLDFLPISKAEFIEYMKSDASPGSLFANSWQFTDVIYQYCKTDYEKNGDDYVSIKKEYDILVCNVSVPLNSFNYGFYKTKYGIKNLPFSKLSFSFSHQSFYASEHKVAFEIKCKDDIVKPTTITEQLFELDADNNTHNLTIREVTGYKTSNIRKNHKDFHEIVSVKELDVPEYIYIDDFAGSMFYGELWAFSIKTSELSFNTTFWDKSRIHIRKFPPFVTEADVSYDSVAISGKLYKHPTLDFYYIDVINMGELKIKPPTRSSGYSSYGDAENRRNGVDS